MFGTLGARQDPLRELAGLAEGRGLDLLSIPLEPLQDCLDRGRRLSFLQRALVDVVNQVRRRREARRSSSGRRSEGRAAFLIVSYRAPRAGF
jgi:hypothetical protein